MKAKVKAKYINKTIKIENCCLMKIAPLFEPDSYLGLVYFASPLKHTIEYYDGKDRNNSFDFGK